MKKSGEVLPPPVRKYIEEGDKEYQEPEAHCLTNSSTYGGVIQYPFCHSSWSVLGPCRPQFRPRHSRCALKNRSWVEMDSRSATSTTCFLSTGTSLVERARFYAQPPVVLVFS